MTVHINTEDERIAQTLDKHSDVPMKMWSVFHDDRHDPEDLELYDWLLALSATNGELCAKVWGEWSGSYPRYYSWCEVGVYVMRAGGRHYENLEIAMAVKGGPYLHAELLHVEDTPIEGASGEDGIEHQ